MADPVNSATNEELKLDAANLYREETITDLKTGSLLRLVPVRPDGGDDSSRPPMFVARTQIMTRMGSLPIEAPLAATSLAEAIAAFPQAIEGAVGELARRVEEHQRESARQIVTPDQLAGGRGGGLIL